jgi:hypothetical protein
MRIEAGPCSIGLRRVSLRANRPLPLPRSTAGTARSDLSSATTPGKLLSAYSTDLVQSLFASKVATRAQPLLHFPGVAIVVIFVPVAFNDGRPGRVESRL